MASSAVVRLHEYELQLFSGPVRRKQAATALDDAPLLQYCVPLAIFILAARLIRIAECS